MKNQKFLQATETPTEDLEKIAIPGQDPKRRMYRDGYEHYFNEMPRLYVNDPLRPAKSNFSKEVMQKLASVIIEDGWVEENDPGEGNFSRTIIALEKPQELYEGLREGFIEGSEFVVAHWGKGFSSPVHGHSTGYMHEEILNGRIRVNTYRMIDPTSNVVRLVETSIVTKGTFVSQYSIPRNYKFKRSILIHNFTALEPTNSLHYLPEHTRDGRDNGFIPEYFEDYFELNEMDVTRVTAHEAMYSRNGEVILVRSENVPEYGDHYIVIIGRPIMKEHGLRPKEVAIIAPHATELLDSYKPEQGLTLLKLNESARKFFHKFHNIKMDGETVIMPTPDSLPL